MKYLEIYYHKIGKRKQKQKSSNHSNLKSKLLVGDQTIEPFNYKKSSCTNKMQNKLGAS